MNVEIQETELACPTCRPASHFILRFAKTDYSA